MRTAATRRVAAWRVQGPAIVQAHPVARIEIADVAPMDNRTWGRDDVRCQDGLGGGVLKLPLSPTRLPRRIWNLLGGYRRLTTGIHVVDGPNNKHYADLESAIEAGCAACLAWAKLPKSER